MNALRIVGRVVAGLLILGLIARQVDLDQMTLVWDNRSALALGSALLLLLMALLLSAVRWRLVLGDDAPGVPFLWRVYLVGWCFSLFLPTSVGGDAVRTVAITRRRTSLGEAVSSIAVERLLGVGALGVYLLIGCLLAPAVLSSAVGLAEWNRPWWQVVIAAAAAGGVFALALRLGARNSRVQAILKDAWTVLRRFQSSPVRMAATVGASLLVQASYILTWYALALGVRINVPFLALLVFVPFVSLAAMLPVTLSGLGVREGAWALLLAPLGVPVADAVGFSLLYYLCSLLLGLVGGALFLTSATDVRTFKDADRHSVAAPIAHTS